MKRKERKKPRNTSIQSKQLGARGVSIDMETSWAAQELTSIDSNLNNMARFQQKQLQEKEQKLLQLYDQQQQRAYQVVQRGSAGSNGSNHAASISQHTVTRTSSSSHTTSTSQGGKVRQMFDERRQTTVKGIDRSYPLEPLENKLRKQPNGNGVQKNGNLTVNRQSVTVKRVARADVNSNLNGGKPVVSYHEEITRESFGPSASQQQDDEEFGNENHDAQYANGNHRGETRIAEVLDEDTMERNRMMAKLHLMEYDESLKNRVRNDLESEQFPEDFLVDVPDKLPKQNVTKKLSQAEARLERFKNANARRSNNIAKNSTTVSKKRSDPMFPSKSSSSKDRAIKARTREVSRRRSSNRNESPGDGKLKTVTSGQVEETISLSDSERNTREEDAPRFFCRESEKSATTYDIDSRSAKELAWKSSKSVKGRSESPKFLSKESEKSATYAIDSKPVTKLSFESLRESPKFFCKESEKSATTYDIDSKNAKELAWKSSKGVKGRSESPKESENSKSPRKLSREPSKDRIRRSDNLKFFCKETEMSATTYAANSKITKRSSPELSKERKPRSESPKLLSKTTKKATKESSEFLKNRKPSSDSPKFFFRESEKSVDSKTHATLPDFAKNTKSTAAKVESTHRRNIANNDKIKGSMGIDTVDEHIKSSKTGTISRSPSPESLTNNPVNYPKFDSEKQSKSISNKSCNVFDRLSRERSSSPRFFHREDKKPTTKTTVVVKGNEFTSRQSILSKETLKERSRSPRVSSPEDDILIPRTTESESPDFTGKAFKKSKTSSQFFTSNSEKSATIMIVKPETITKSRRKSPGSTEKEQISKACVSKSSKNTRAEAKMPEVSNVENTKHFIRSSVSRFFSEQSKRALRNAKDDARDNVQSTGTDKNSHLSGGSSPLSLRYTRTPSPTRSEFHRGKTGKPGGRSIDGSRDSSPRSGKIVHSGEATPEFFCYETERSATTVSVEPRATKDIGKRAKSPETAVKPRSPVNDPKSRSSKSTDSTKDAESPDRRGSVNILRSTKLIREAMKRQNEKNRGNCASDRRVKSLQNSPGGYGDTGGISNGSKQRGARDKVVEDVEADRKVDKRAGTPSARELPVAESSPKSCTSAEVDAEIQEITVPDQYVKQEQLWGTYSRSGNKTGRVSRVERQFTYSMSKPTKKRGSLFGADVFEPSRRDRMDRRDSSEERRISLRRTTGNASNSSPSPTNESVVRELKRRTGKDEISRSEERTSSPARLKGKRTKETTKEKYDNSKRGSSSGSPTNESIVQKRRAEENLVNGRSAREQTPASLIQGKQRRMNVKGRTRSPQATKQARILRSMELVRQAIKGSNFEEGGVSVKKGQIEVARSDSTASTTIEVLESSLVSTKDRASPGKNYERTDSVESALRRFDSIGTEADSESARSTLERRRESTGKKRQTELGETEGSRDVSKTISLKVLDRPDVNLPRRSRCRLSRTAWSKASTVSIEPCYKRGKSGRTQETQGPKKCRKSKDSMEISGVAETSKSPACKRKLFQDDDSGEETESGSWKSKNSLNSMRAMERLSSKSNKNQTVELVESTSRRYEFATENETSMAVGMNKEGTDKTSTGADRFLSVKQLRSIEDIRKSIEGESSDGEARGMSRKSAIANSAGRRSSGVEAAGRSEPRRINIDDRGENRKVISLPARSGNNDALGNADRSSVKCSMRFSRVAKSPSPETMKPTETGSRRRRSVQTSLSKSPDTVARRPSVELKAQDAKSTKRPTPMKGTEPIGNRKTTGTTSTGTRKSTDVVDGVILENGLHLRDQTAETIYDNDSPTTKKSDAFVIDFDEQPPKENDAPLLRKPLLRKQSTEKQIPSTPSARPPSSVSSISSGSSMQGQVSGSRGRMASKAKTSNSASITSKGSASSRSGGCAAAADSLVACKVCGRRFAQDRITLHEQICTKTGQKKRKQFDTMMFRVKGTDLEPFVKKGFAKKQAEKSKKPEVKSNWRRKHEDFINAIRSAKQVQAHLAAGGKLSDLPPPPVSDNCDYIQCPHCGRKFNQAAAERHIPKCEHMLHNKPIHSRAPKPRR
ncbi:PREDICTED: serine/arginine repetitive matrix protein 2-like [Habropoda laboriosa]|uniref:serine/arginine repetitive matrix protein 2-like n=1 Tax=Habropoda laboriosa TaxID=597456 RepID=UPI00083D2B9A|nr:PREDICTED: serine/arginine repetitive matrix protein 2-like [Habropoda laboriosa]